MKRFLCAVVSVCLLLSLAACQSVSAEQQLAEALAKQQSEIKLYTGDVTELFQNVFTAHPEYQFYLRSMNAKSEGLSVHIQMEFEHTNVPSEWIRVGKSEEVFAPTLTEALTEVRSYGAMILTGEKDQPDPEAVLEDIRRDDYLVAMGIDATEWVFSGNDFTNDMIVYFTIDYIDGKEEILSAREQVKQEVEKLSGTLWSESDAPETRVRAIHDYLVSHAEYASQKESTLRDHTPYGVLIKGEGVCDSYTYAAHLLLRAAGVESLLAAGTFDGSEHAWNVVKLGENYYHLDITWDDPVGAPAGYKTYAYYLKGDATMKKDHEWTMKLPSCPADWKE